MLLIWRFALLLAILAGMGRIAVNEIGRYYESIIKDQHDPAINKALFWKPHNANALYLLAKRVINTDATYATDLARRAYLAEPVNAKALRLLAELSVKNGNVVLSDQLIKQAALLAVADARLLLDIATYWDKRGQVKEVVANLGKALTAKPALQKDIFPVLSKIVETPSMRGAIVPFTQSPPLWWDAFYSYVIKRTVAIDTVGMLLGLRLQSKVKISTVERDVSVSFFIKENQWSRAYLLWANGLPAKQASHLGNVFNGGFEWPISNRGFDWRIPPANGVVVVQDGTHGVQGEKALHLVFDGTEFLFSHFYQYLFLHAGNYNFSVLTKTNELQGRGGLVWELSCLNGKTERLIAKTGRVIGTSEWKTLTIDFVIPSGLCTSQSLRLRSVGSTLYDNKLEGDAWFDNVQIINTRNM